VCLAKINYNKLVAYRGRAFSFGQEQIYHIGYTGLQLVL
jgi:hypothetical protein